ncbi:MAG: pyruvate dehydrogenase complex dihydrolipoamide acetyltransferase [Proteobacteria bacterium]|nr:pyruvate dehydrogenase complex dihydrolipoamide acetyltransferase [Pseudomonadota bacterium]
MTIEITMPALSPTMSEGTLARWLKKEGDAISAGDVIAEIETDKATMEVEAVDEGTLGKILVPDGTEGVAVNAPIAILLEEGEDESALKDAGGSAGGGGTAAKAEKPEPVAEKQAPQESKKGEASAPATEAKPAQQSGSGDRLVASPLAKRMAQQAGIDLSKIPGSGPHRRVVKADIEAMIRGDGKAQAASAAQPARQDAAAAKPSAPAPAAKSPTLPDDLLPAYEEIPHSGMRKVIAKRMAESKQTAPHFYVTMDCEIDALLETRKALNARAPKDGPDAYRISVNDFVVRAAALALLKVPAANATWTETATRRFSRADVSVAVALDDGLITPVIRDASGKGLAAISRETKDLAERARAGKLAPEEYQGGTFTVSNLGMFGVREFSAVINPGQGAILAVGAGEQRPVVKNGALAIATVMSCTLSVDHRSIDGAVGAQLMQAFKRLIEDPLTMLL